jgi:chromosome segregation ATPase
MNPEVTAHVADGEEINSTTSMIIRLIEELGIMIDNKLASISAKLLEENRQQSIQVKDRLERNDEQSKTINDQSTQVKDRLERNDEQSKTINDQSTLVKDLLERNDEQSKTINELSKTIGELKKRIEELQAESSKQLIDKKQSIEQIDVCNGKNGNVETCYQNGIMNKPATFPISYVSTFPFTLGNYRIDRLYLILVIFLCL